MAIMAGVEGTMRRILAVSVVIGALAGAGSALSLMAGQQGSAQPPASLGQTPVGQSGTIRTNVDLVSVYFTVRDSKKRLEPHLEKTAFRVYEDGHEQPIEFFAHHSDVPLDLGVMLDTGTNMARILGLEAEAATLFFQRVVRTNDMGFVISYDSRVNAVQVPTGDLEQLRDQIQTIRRFGHPDDMAGPPRSPWPGGSRPPGIPDTNYREAHLYDAVRIGVHRYLRDEVGRKAVVIVALSDDSQSESTLDDALEALLQSDVIAYVMQIYDGPHDNCDVRHEFRADKLKRLAEETGGRVLDVRGMEKMNSAFEEISEELHNQYSLGYRPSNTNWDGKFRKMQITAQGYRVFSRKGYYATPRKSASASNP
jgi:VWFA-related protein